MISRSRIDPRRTALACVPVALSVLVASLYSGDPRSFQPLLLVMAASVGAGVIAGSYRAVPIVVLALYISSWAINGVHFPGREAFVQVAGLSLLAIMFFATLVSLGVWLSGRRR